MTSSLNPRFECPDCGRSYDSRTAVDLCCTDADDDLIGDVAYWRSHN